MTTYRITPVKHWDGKWAWYAVRDHEFGGTTPDFKIAKADHYNMAANEWLCCWSQAADTDTWTNFDNIVIGATDLEFSNDDPFPAGLIYVAHLPMYPFSRTQRKINEWGQSEWVAETPSTTNFIIDTATPRATVDGRTAPALPFYGFKIEGDRVGDKNKAILTAFNHPSETPGAFVFEGAIEWLLGDSAEAEVLRDYFEFYVYPCLNPQGVWSGYFRSCPENATLDHNREWDDTGVLECIDAFKTAMAADTGGTIDVGFDYHSYMAASNIHGTVYTGDTTGLYGYYETEMVALDGDFDYLQTDILTGLIYEWRDNYSAGLTMYIEQGGETIRNVSDWKTYGENTMKALYEMLVDGRFTNGP